MHHIVEEDLQTILSAPLPWDQLDGATLLMTGANGFLPAYSVETLLYRNQYLPDSRRTKVLALVRNADKARRRFAEYQDRDDLQLIVQDVTSPIRIEGEVDYIVHAASQASPKYYGSDPVGTLTANVQGTFHLLELARIKKTKGFLFFSSGEVYGTVDDAHVPTREIDYGYVDPTKVRSCYAEGKRMGENMCVCWGHQFGVRTTIARPFHTYGPGMALDDGRSFADFVGDILAHRDIVMKSTGTAQRAFCYLSDATAGFFTVLLKGESGEAYNVGNTNAEISIIDLAQTLVRVFPERKLKVVRGDLHDQGGVSGYLQSPIPRNVPDTTKVKALGWQATTGVEVGFWRTVMSFE